MGVVKDTLNAIHADLLEGQRELLAKIDEVEARDHLDDEDKAALAALRDTAASFAAIVPNAVVEPLPDPDVAPAEDAGEPVVSPDAPVDDAEGEEVPVADEAPAAEAPAEDAAVTEETPVEVSVDEVAAEEPAAAESEVVAEDPTETQ